MRFLKLSNLKQVQIVPHKPSKTVKGIQSCEVPEKTFKIQINFVFISS